MLNIAQIEENVKKFSKKFTPEDFAYELLVSYGVPKATVTRAKKGNKNLAKNENEIVIKKKLFYAYFKSDVEVEFEKLIDDAKTFSNDPRFVIVVDEKKLFALDTKLGEKVSFQITDFPKKFDFFLPFAGIEKKEFQHENPIDVKAAQKLAKLFDLIKADNPKSDDDSLHSLNVFLTRLLFCYFAEDTEIFPSGIFTRSIASHTQQDGSDLTEYLLKLFKVMNQEKRPGNLPDYLDQFPYVNGGLFAENHPIPKFSKKSREVLIDVGDLNWAEINPDIFGSMIQSVVHPDQRAGLGMHYTSVSNIMKVIEPLFLNDLRFVFEKSKNDEKKLRKLLIRLSKIRVFDPACGSGNFLIIAYKELRKLEMDILLKMSGEMKVSYIPLSNFFGIEIDDFAHEVAVLSLWLAEHQMDVRFKNEFGEVKASLPLKDGGNIVHGNAAIVDWHEVCPFDDEYEVYLLGNPPYLGASLQKTHHKKDIETVFGTKKYPKKVDYIICWFLKASDYIKCGGAFSFVTTNSISQGEQVDNFWPHIFKYELEIFFAYRSFLWTNNAQNKAAVSVSIIGVRKKSKKAEAKYIYKKDLSFKVKNINAYLISGPDVIVKRRTKAISSIPSMIKGNMPIDGGFYMFTQVEKNEFLAKEPNAKKFFKRILGTKEYIGSIERWCLWITNEDLKEAVKLPLVKDRIDSVRNLREAGGSQAQGVSHRPHQFYAFNRAENVQLFISRVSSERRDYIPIGFIDKEVVISDAAQVIYDPEPFIYSILSSRIHMVWMKTVAGRLENRYRYSAGVCYNSFPLPKISEEHKVQMEEITKRFIATRAKYPDKTPGDLYDPDLMPDDLKLIHLENDLLVDELFREEPFRDDDERLEVLFKLFEEMTKDL